MDDGRAIRRRWRSVAIHTIRLFAISKLGWIRQQQCKFLEQERETPRAFLERESHCVWGKRYLLIIAEADARPSVELKNKRMVITTRPGTTDAKRHQIVEDWYRDQIKSLRNP